MASPNDSRLIRALLSDRPVTYKPIVARALKRTEAAKRNKGVTTATVFLSNVLYWDAKTTDPDGWIYKDRDELEEETGLTRYEQERARAFLVAAGVIEEERRGFPARMHYRVLYDPLLDLLRVEAARVAEKKAQEEKSLQNAERHTVWPTERRHRLSIKKERKSRQLEGDTVSPTDLSGTTSGKDDQSLTSVTQSSSATNSGRPSKARTPSTDGLIEKNEKKTWQEISEAAAGIPPGEVTAEALDLGRELSRLVDIDTADAARLAELYRRQGKETLLTRKAKDVSGGKSKHPWPYLLTSLARAEDGSESELRERMKGRERSGGEQETPASGPLPTPESDPEAAKVWSLVLADLYEEIDAPSWRVWFEGTVPTDLEKDTLTLCVPNDFAEQYIGDRFKESIESSLKARLSSPSARLRLQVLGGKP